MNSASPDLYVIGNKGGGSPMMHINNINFKVNERSKQWKCCFCCHVRTGTVFVGTWHMMLHIVALVALSVLMCHPEYFDDNNLKELRLEIPIHKNQNSEFDIPTPISRGTIEMKSEDFQVTLSEAPAFTENSVPSNKQLYYTHRMTGIAYKDLNVGMLVTFCTLAITFLMLYGAIKGKPAYLMPFFCLQVFDFCLSVLTMIGYLCYLPNAHMLLDNLPLNSTQSRILKAQPALVIFFLFCIFLISVIVKGYFIGVVWSCYKYLTLRMLSHQRTIHYIDPDVQTLLPDHDDSFLKKTRSPPPSYSIVVGATTDVASNCGSTSSLSAPPPYNKAVQLA